RILLAEIAPGAAMDEDHDRSAGVCGRKQVELFILGRAVDDVSLVLQTRARRRAARYPSIDHFIGVRRPRALIVAAGEFRMVVIEIVLRSAANDVSSILLVANRAAPAQLAAITRRSRAPGAAGGPRRRGPRGPSGAPVRQRSSQASATICR